MTPLDIVVLTGFLGSGKTTLLRDYLARPDAAGTAVIVNEVGEIGLDGAILQEGRGGLSMAMLANGCVCCQQGNDLADTIAALLETDRPLHRIVLETSGLSKPGPVLRQMAALTHLPMRVSVVATFDAVRGAAVTQFAEAAAQWAAANRIVATRMDMVPAARADAVASGIAAINPLAEVVATPDRHHAVSAAFAPLPPVTVPRMPEAARAAHRPIAVRLVRPARLPTYEELATWLDNLAGALGDRLLRLKGLVRVAGCTSPLLVQSVGTLFSAPRPFRTEPDQPCFLVLIALDLDGAELDVILPEGLFTSRTSA